MIDSEPNVEPIFDDQIGGEPPAGLYDYATLITEGIDGLSSVTDAHVQQFAEQGFLVIHNAFQPDEIERGLAGLMGLIRGENPRFSGVMFETAARQLLDGVSPDERVNLIRKLMWFVEYDDRLKALAEHPALCGVVAWLVGDQPDMFQDMALIKPPRIGREKPWHQDMAYFNLPTDTPVVGVWIALDEATPENGCMMVIPGSHREGPVTHFQRRDWQICDTDVQLPRVAAIPLQPGGCLIFSGLLQHGTPPSRSDKQRRAVQYHYKPAGIPLDADDTRRLMIFGEDGKGVYC